MAGQKYPIHISKSLVATRYERLRQLKKHVKSVLGTLPGTTSSLLQPPSPPCLRIRIKIPLLGVTMSEHLKYQPFLLPFLKPLTLTLFVSCHKSSTDMTMGSVIISIGGSRQNVGVNGNLLQLQNQFQSRAA